MKSKFFFLTFCTLSQLIAGISQAQNMSDSSRFVSLKNVEVKAFRTINGMGHLPEIQEQIIYAGKKNEVLIIDTIDANKAINNTRQILGRIPGLNIVETETGGFTANGIGTRGLDANQSIEMNMMQNGYNISADLFGYNESYYLPPMEAVQRIEVLRGASSLQFGPQLGGTANYILKRGPANRPIRFYTSQTAGSFGLFNSFNALGGNIKSLNYYGFVQFRTIKGWRPNSDQTQWSGHVALSWKATEKFTIGAEYSFLRNRIHMPGGLSDDQFAGNSRASYRSRNWLRTPWNVASLNMSYQFTDNTSISLKSTYMNSKRELVWRNEDVGPEVLDTIDPLTGQFSSRELGKQNFQNIYNDLRFITNYYIGTSRQSFAAGLRVGYSKLHRQGGGEGTTGSDFDLTLVGDKFEYDLNFTNLNVAAYVEHVFRVGERLSITPGVRLEYIASGATGYKEKSGVELIADMKRKRVKPLLGIGLEYKYARGQSLYANVSQSYRPITYSVLTPFGVTSKIDPNLKDGSGLNSDLGFRGSVKNIFNYDISAFLLQYRNRVGLILQTDPNTGQEYTLRTNLDASIHAGLETYLEINVLKLLTKKSNFGSLSVFNSLAYMQARYTRGSFKGNRVEYAPDLIVRTGVNYSIKGFSVSWQLSHQSYSYGDASNAAASSDPSVGKIPAYYVMDLSASYKYKSVGFRAGINNVSDQKYFTRRADEYPGPGIIPSIGRNLYIGINAEF